MDQAAVLRQIRNKGKGIRQNAAVIPAPGLTTGQDRQERVRVISITSGKGGVGKTHITANLAYLFSKMNKKTLVFDADMGLANIDVILGTGAQVQPPSCPAREKTLPEALSQGRGTS